ncbi:ATP-dependent RNA helicase DDX24 isoform X3 [Camelus bactrianus]|uniref:ATP-dependent RNA helicase DDX24 isoform X3 n=1 Tax=Camelus bactrianus TaxID=9837 RepID=A0AC58QFY9_CAMBA
MKLKETKSRPRPPSYGKFQRKGIKVVGKWKQVEIDPNMFADGQMDDLVCFEELTDYRLVSPAKNSSSLFSKEEPKKRKAQAVSEGAEEGEASSSKKKIKLKKSKDVGTEGTSAPEEFNVKDAEPEPQGDGTVCPDPEVGETASEGPTQTVPKKKKKKGKKKSEPSQGTTPKVPKKAKTWMPEMHDHKADVSAWKDLFVPKPVLRALSFLGFSAPTPIQALALAPAIRDKLDILGAAETGIKTAILVGGMSTQKQQRMLNHQPEIVIATPGRLWELVKEKHPHLSNLRQLRCLVLDEADRMVEKGHFAELSQLLEMLSDSQYNPKRQTLVFSATLTLVHQAPARILHKKHAKKIDKTAKLDLLVQKIGMRGKPKVIDLTRNEATVETLTETKIHCETDEKDLYLYYFLMQYPGRTLVFANSISCIKRLSGLLKVLDIMPLTLHACMHQKQRLRNLEQFAHLEDCVLLATDVAARGLDIPKVQHVIHYQVPRTSEIYVHRSGRTARATNEGLSLMLVGPEDVINFKKIYKTLKKDEDIPLFPVQSKYMDAVKERIRLARQIEKAEYRNFQACLHNSWIEQAAAALEIELEEEMYKGGKVDEQEERRRQKQMKVLKKELRHLLSQPLFKDDLKTKYPTQSGKLPVLVSAPSSGESALGCLSKQKKKKKKKPKEQQQRQPQPSSSAD